MARKPAKATAERFLEAGELTDLSQWQRAERGFAQLSIILPSGEQVQTMVSVYNALQSKDTAGVLLICADEATLETVVYSIRLSGVAEGNTTRYATPSEVFDALARGAGTLYLRSVGLIGRDEEIVPETLSVHFKEVPLEYEDRIIPAETMAGQGKIVEIVTQE